AFMQRLTVTHSARWKQHKKQVGFGHLSQGRYKSFPIEADDHFLKVVRYGERNAWRANLVHKVEHWKWSSWWIGKFGSAPYCRWLSPWPVPAPRNWAKHVHRPETEAELQALRRSVNRGTPFGSSDGTDKTAKRLGLEFTTRSRGRPKKR
ncbi:MAG: hypothetical protein GTO14_14250, partial [Anaerolineales bacterium]|nr:hypothetical protein [Anaerolineales bacterium]